MTTHTEMATGQEKTERSPLAVPVIGSGGACPICGALLRGRQTSACSDRCRAALSRRKRASKTTKALAFIETMMEAGEEARKILR